MNRNVANKVVWRALPRVKKVHVKPVGVSATKHNDHW